MALFTVKTPANQEPAVVDEILDRGPDGIHSALAPAATSGYVFVEATDRATVDQLPSVVPRIQKVLDGETSMAEVEHFLSPGSDVADVSMGDRVEITTGAYEGDTATVQNVNAAAEEVTVELEDEVISIPITLRGDHIRRV